MQIAGFVKNSFVDYPGHIAAVVFVPGCNMDCWYCHNRPLWNKGPLLSESDVFDFLKNRRAFLDGVVISGGEPTLQKDLSRFICRVRDMDYLVKLDTNGLLPDAVASLLGSVNYTAMDIKAPPGGIARVVSFDLDEAPLWQCADLLMRSGFDYEFRTTMMPTLSALDISRIAERIKGAKRYVLQQYRRPGGIAIHPEPHSPETIKKAAEAAKAFVPDVRIRGI